MNPLAHLCGRLVFRGEHLVKGLLFDCRACGQCVLSKTGLVCPMTCPKQLRNGPCGGSTHEHCEVFPDRKCVWVRIRKRQDRHGCSLPVLLSGTDPHLFYTASYLNLLTGKDKPARIPLPYLELPPNRKQLPPQTPSVLEARLKQGKFVFTSEIRSPRGARPDIVEKQGRILNGHFDAVNATAYLNGHASMPSPEACAILADMGLDSICQTTCRDDTKTSFMSELIQHKIRGVNNILCLTGDYYKGEVAPRQVFDMDSASMLYEARYVREKGVIHYSGDVSKDPPRLFLGGAINPFTTPMNVPMRRLKQKWAAGVDFIQTQVILDVAWFKEFMALFCAEGLDKDVFLLAGVPVIISEKAFAMLPEVPGVVCPDAVRERFAAPADIVVEGIAFAREMIQELKTIPGVSGVHLMLFGMDHTVLPKVVEGL